MANDGKQKPDPKLVPFQLGFTGKWKPALDGTQLADGDMQTLTNMRYTSAPGIKSISGMTKINTTPISTYLKLKSGFHFTKDKPSESHLLVQGFNAAETQAVLYDNTTAIPSAGNFSGTAVYTDSPGSSPATWSLAPDGCIIYNNAKESCVWGGTEYRCANFVIGDLVEEVKYDYTKVINNILTDSSNLATMHSISDTVDANTMLLLHCNGADASTTFTDSSPTTPHTVTANGNAQIDTAYSKFGGASGLFDGTGDYLTIPDNADFDLSSGVWTIDFWMRATGAGIIYYHQTDVNNMFYVSLEATKKIFLTIVSAGSAVVLVGSAALDYNTWYHIAIVEDGNKYYVFVNGSLSGSLTDTDRPADYTGASVYIGSNATPGSYFTGHIDEFRISNSARWTSNFTPPTQAYGATTTCYNYIASTRPIKGVKYYIGTANTTVATCQPYYWNGSSWVVVTGLSDGTRDTATSTKTLAQTGIISFTSTLGLAKPKFINDAYLYWYLFIFNTIDATTTVSYVTTDAPMQPLIDLWDGRYRPVASFLQSDATATYADYTLNVLDLDYLASSAISYLPLDSLASSAYLYAGFTERMAALGFGMGSPEINSNASVMQISYWNGSAWTTVGGLDDQTSVSGASLGRSGRVSWNVIAENTEFPLSLSGGPLLYYYRINFTNALDASIDLDYVYGFPTPRILKAYKLSANWQNRVILVGEVAGYKNSILIGATGSVCVFNGDDSLDIYSVGDDSLPTAVGSIFTRYTGAFYDTLIVCKKNETWILDGTDVATYRLFRVSNLYGCVAPDTFKVFPTSYELAPGINRHIAIWQSASGMVLFDGNTVVPISDDISNYFDLNSSDCINSTYLDISTSFVDEREQEYHWIFASGASATGLNTELVYNINRKAWYKVNRGVTLQCGIPVRDTKGNAYTYGGLATGYVERLEYGNTFDDTAIISTVKTRDFIFNNWLTCSLIRFFKLIFKAKTTAGRVTVTHFADTNTSGDSTTISCNPNSSAQRVVQTKEGTGWGANVFHALQLSLTTSDQSTAFEPVGIAGFWQFVREDT